MTHFTAWALAWVACPVFAAWVLAWALSGPSGSPAPAVPIRLELAGQRRAPWDREGRPQVREPHTLPLCSGIQQPIPFRIVSRTLPPSIPGEEPLLIHGQAHRVVVMVRDELPEEPPVATPEELPVPATIRVVPLWVARWEDQQKAVRLRALQAAALGEPDPGYTYPGAHSLAS